MRADEAALRTDVVRLASRFGRYGPPEHLRSDNGPEFTAKLVRRWLARLGVQWRRLYNTVRPHSAWGGLPPAPEAVKPSSWFLRMP